MFSKFFTILSDCVDRHVPLKKMSKKSLKFKTKPWISTRIQKLIAYRDRLLKNTLEQDVKMIMIYIENLEIV